MTRISAQQRVQTELTHRNFLKVIAGINNLDLPSVLTLVRAATQANASAIDIAARADIVSAARKLTSLPLFASSVSPKELAEAVNAGADVVEVGNYDALYEEGLFFTADEVLQIAKETLALVQGRALVSVTLPGHLSIDTQIKLAHALETLGVDILQTEGAARVLSAEPSIQNLSVAQKAEITLNNTRQLAQAVRLPLLCASGLTEETIQEAIEAGASGVGVGTAIRAYQHSEQQMIQAIKALQAKLTAQSVRVNTAQAS